LREDEVSEAVLHVLQGRHQVHTYSQIAYSLATESSPFLWHLAACIFAHHHLAVFPVQNSGTDKV
jgi:hypothetical protein